MATKQPPEQPEQQIDVTAAEWLMIIVTGFTGIFAGPFAIIPGAVVVGMFTYRLNPELMKASAAGQWVRGLLPAPTPEQDAPNSPNSPKASATPSQAQPATRDTAAKGKPARELEMIDLDTLARCSTLLLVGSRGSGKSTLLRAILAAKREPIMVYDPHAHPAAWPMAAMLHNTEKSISTGMASAFKRMLARREEMRKGIRTEGWPKFTLAADEWGSIVASVKLPKDIDMTPGQVSTELMKQGRKFEIGFVAGAHGLTNASLGCTGDQDAFLQSFDWIVSMGGFLRKMLPKEHAYLIDQIPMGTNDQGGTFPLIVACESPSTGEIRLIDMRGFEKLVDIRPAPMVPTLPWEQPKASADSALLTGLLGTSQTDMQMSQADMNATAAQSDPTYADMPTDMVPTVAETALISMSLSQKMSASQIVRKLPGYNGRTHKAYMTKVEYVKRLLDIQPASETPEASTDDDEEPPSWFSRSFDG